MHVTTIEHTEVRSCRKPGLK